MITLTEDAANKIKDFIETSKEDHLGVRLGVRGGGCSGFSYFIEALIEASKKDRKIESHGITLYVDPKSYLYLMGTEVSYVNDLSGSGFKFGNPNARRTCGCGESFSI